MTTLIQRAEQAATREEAVAVFYDAMDALPNRPGDYDLCVHDAWAERAGSDTRALGYLLLAALSLTEGDDFQVDLHIWKGSDGNTYARCQYGHDDPADSGTCRIPACALLAAILRAQEATNG